MSPLMLAYSDTVFATPQLIAGVLVGTYFIKKFKAVSPSLAKKKGKTISEDDLKEAALNGETKIDVPVQSISDLEARLKQDIEDRHRNFIKGNK